MPNRMIKESIHTSEKVNAMTDFQFRLWINLIAYVDDYGRGDARPAVIKGACFPLRERLSVKDIQMALTGLAGIGCVILYEVDGRPYLCFPNWEKHQTIRNKRSKFPEPPKSILQAIENNCNQLNANVSVIQSNPSRIQSESKSEARAREDGKIPPDYDEAAAYYAEKGFTFGLEKWFAKYDANGWRVGRDKMKDWKASMRYWQQLENENPKRKPPMEQTAQGDRDPASIARKQAAMEKMVAAMKGKGSA